MAKDVFEIGEFKDGIGVSYIDKFASFVNCDLDAVKGVCIANLALISQNVPDVTVTTREFTADNVADVFTLNSHEFVTAQAVTVSTTNTLPTGLAISTTYYIIENDADSFKLASTAQNALDGTEINITSDGVGVQSITGTAMSEITKIVLNPYNADFGRIALDKNQRVWFYVSGFSVWTHIPGNNGGLGYGMEVWKNYLFVFRSSTIDVYGDLAAAGDTASWTTSWNSIDSDSTIHPSLVGQDDAVYIGAGRYVASIIELVGQNFAPGNAATYTFTQQALDLPEGYKIKTMVELGINLMLGTWRGTDIFSEKVADIFPWDRSSPSFSLPLRLKENGINQMIEIDNLLYFFAGHEGSMYVSDGTNVSLFKEIPTDFFNIQQTAGQMEFQPNAICRHKGRIFFGISAYSATAVSPLGVFSINVDTGRLLLENTFSTGNTGATSRMKVGALLSITEEQYLVGYVDNDETNEDRIDRIDQTVRYAAYKSYFETGMRQVGTNRNKRTYERATIYLGKLLDDNSQEVQLQYRTNKSDDYTTLGSIDGSDGSISEKTFDFSIAVSFVQFRVRFDTPGDLTTPELIKIELE